MTCFVLFPSKFRQWITINPIWSFDLLYIWKQLWYRAGGLWWLSAFCLCMCVCTYGPVLIICGNMFRPIFRSFYFAPLLFPCDPRSPSLIKLFTLLSGYSKKFRHLCHLHSSNTLNLVQWFTTNKDNVTINKKRAISVPSLTNLI